MDFSPRNGWTVQGYKVHNASETVLYIDRVPFIFAMVLKRCKVLLIDPIVKYANDAIVASALCKCPSFGL